MHDSENGTHLATAAETLVLTNNLVYSEPSTYFDHVINHHHHHLHTSYHHNYHTHTHHQNLHLNHIQNHSYHDTQYNHGAHLSNADLSNNDICLHQNQRNTAVSETGSTSITLHPEIQQPQDDQLITLPYTQVEGSSLIEPQSKQTPSETHFVNDIMIDATERLKSSDHNGIKASEYTTLSTSETNMSKLEEKMSVVSETLSVDNCNTESNFVVSDSNTSTLASTLTASSPTLDAAETILKAQSSPPHEQFYSTITELTKTGIECFESYQQKTNSEEEGDEEDEEEEEEDDDDDDVDDEDELVDDDDDNDDEEEEGEDEDDDDDDEDDESEDDSEDIVDPGQNCQLIQNTFNESDLNEHGEVLESENNVLDGERLLEVTRKLVRSTERDPDRDLRKQVLLKTAIKKLPHFMEYSHYSDSLDRSFHNSMSPQAYYEHHDSQQKFYPSVQPNAIQMSTTSLRMLDLNDDQDPELNSIEQGQQLESSLVYNRTSSDQHDYVNQNQYERYYRTQDINHYEPNSPMISRHNSLDNLYQPINGNDIGEDVKDGDERIPIAFQIACELYDFTCTPDDNDRKLLDNLTNGYYIRPTKEPRTANTNDGGEDGTDTRDQEESDTSSSSHSSSSDESANSLVSQSTESEEIIGTSLLEASLNSTNEFYHSSHDSGVALFSTRSNKRSSSSIGFDDEMEIDHLTELSTRSPSIGSNNQYKKLRKREIID